MRDTEKVTKEPYEPPTVEDVPLHPDETMMGMTGCKTAFQGGPQSGLGCFASGTPCMGVAAS